MLAGGERDKARGIYSLPVPGPPMLDVLDLECGCGSEAVMCMTYVEAAIP